MDADFDFSLLSDSTLAQLFAAQSTTKKVPPAPTPTKQSSPSTSDWFTFSPSVPDSVVAPHPDLFESDIDSLLFDTDLSSFPNLDYFEVSHNNHNFYQYRSPNGGGNSAYSGYNPSTITASSESLSAYGSAYEPLDHLLPTSKNPPSTALSSLFNDIDLTAYTDDAMLPRRSSDIDSILHDTKPVTHHNTPSAYFAVPSRNTDYLTSISAQNQVQSQHQQQQQQQQRSVPANGNSTLVSANVNPPTSPSEGDHDPRKKYQCPSCPRAFARAFNLKTHMATHDPHRVKSFQCHHSGCGRSFSRKHDLGRHLVSIHQDASVAGSATAAAASGSVSRGSMAVGNKSPPSSNGAPSKGARYSTGSEEDYRK